MSKAETLWATLDGEGNRRPARRLERVDPDLPTRGLIKWGSVTAVLPERPRDLAELAGRIGPMLHDPRPHDVMLGQVVEMGRHTGLELDCGRKARFIEGDLLGLAFGYRYATRLFHGEVPPLSPDYDVLSQGGVCGRVCSAPDEFLEPTVVRAIGYLLDAGGKTVNLRDYALAPMEESPRVETILVVGSSMDAGKTTTAESIIRGLHRGGRRVHAGKLTGTACVKDLLIMYDAGAAEVMDFTSVGFASTAQAAAEELACIVDVIGSRLAAGGPEFLVLEIADGLVQRETELLMDYLAAGRMVDHVLLAVHDAMAAPTCVELLRRRWQLSPAAISGAATVTPLSTEELRRLVDAPCLSREQLSDPVVAAGIVSNPLRVVATC